MKGPPMTIELQENAILISVNGARPIPFAQRDKVKQMLDKMVGQGIIAPVTQPTEWVHPLVVAAKPYGKLRLCVDLTRLNHFVKRPIHPLVTPRHAVAHIPEAQDSSRRSTPNTATCSYHWTRRPKT